MLFNGFFDYSNHLVFCVCGFLEVSNSIAHGSGGCHIFVFLFAIHSLPAPIRSVQL